MVLAHGFGGSLESWYEYGYVRSLSDDHRLILIDARGHGASDKPLDPAAYSSALMVGGHPAQALINAADGADLLVVGSRGHGSFAEALLGSVSQHCVHHAPCPVLIARGEPDR
jgi:nucleotide-binding universal stress UspA family protein